jgi:hypothetical protein
VPGPDSRGPFVSASRLDPQARLERRPWPRLRRRARLHRRRASPGDPPTNGTRGRGRERPDPGDFRAAGDTHSASGGGQVLSLPSHRALEPSRRLCAGAPGPAVASTHALRARTRALISNTSRTTGEDAQRPNARTTQRLGPPQLQGQAPRHLRGPVAAAIRAGLHSLQCRVQQGAQSTVQLFQNSDSTKVSVAEPRRPRLHCPAFCAMAIV